MSVSETWYAVTDHGTNYCNLYNLIEGNPLHTVLHRYTCLPMPIPKGLMSCLRVQQGLSGSSSIKASGHWLRTINYWTTTAY